MTGIVALCLTLYSFYTGCHAGSLEWGDIPATLTQGDTLTIRCNAVVTEGGQYLQRLYRVLQRADGEKKFEIATFQVLHSDYHELGRYSVKSVVQSDTERYMELTITDLQGYDGGLIRCWSTDAPAKTMQFHVSTPLSSVSFSALDEFERGSVLPQRGPTPTVMLEEGTLMGLACTVQNTNSGIIPEASISLRGNDTDKFVQSLIQNTTAVGSVPDGIVNYVSTVQLKYMGRTPSWEWDGQTIVCTGEMPGFDPKSASVLLDIRHKPVFRCDDVDFYARVGQTAVLSCSVFSNPRGDVTATWGDESVVLSSAGGTYVDRYSLEVQAGEETSEQVVVLTIQAVTRMDLDTSIFTIRSENKYGLEGQLLQLMEGDRPGAVGSASSVHHYLLPALLMCSLVTLLH